MICSIAAIMYGVLSYCFAYWKKKREGNNPLPVLTPATVLGASIGSMGLLLAVIFFFATLIYGIGEKIGDKVEGVGDKVERIGQETQEAINKGVAEIKGEIQEIKEEVRDSRNLILKKIEKK